MKKMIILLLVLFFAAPLFSGEKSSEARFKITSLIKNDKSLNNFTLHEISNLSSELTFSESNYIFNKYEKKAAGPFFLNLFVGFGVGSFYQGDTVGGTIGITGDLLTNAAMLFLYFDYYSNLIELSNKRDEHNYGSEKYEEYADKMSKDYQQFTMNILFTSGVSLCIKLFQYIRPFAFANSYNDKLRNALVPEFSFAPTLNNDKELCISMGASIRL